jgi:hypothetical protein
VSPSRESPRRSAATTNSEELQRTVFGRVLSELLEQRGIAATPETVGQRVIDRMASTDVPYAGPLGNLADELELNIDERLRLSLAFTFEEDRTFPFL